MARGRTSLRGCCAAEEVEEWREWIIARLVETEGKDALTRVQLSFTEVSQAWLTNLAEENQKELEVQESILEVPVRPFEIVTLRVKGKGKKV